MAPIPPAPRLSSLSAHILMLTYSSSYVASLYLSKNARLKFSSHTSNTSESEGEGTERSKGDDERWRNDPDVIRARLTAVLCATVFSCGLFTVVLWNLEPDPLNSLLVSSITRLGLIPSVYYEDVWAHLITPTLFLGPLYASWLDGSLPGQKKWSYRYSFLSKFFSWQGIRNYIAGPITEEIVFRACVFATYALSGASLNKMIFLGPLSFGIAHLHHAWDIYNRFGRTRDALRRAILTVLFQLGYTTLFGFHCSYLFLRTSSLYPAITAHIFCNIMGVPALGEELRVFPRRRISMITAYVAGILGFVYTLPLWSYTRGSLYWRT